MCGSGIGGGATSPTPGFTFRTAGWGTTSFDWGTSVHLGLPGGRFVHQGPTVGAGERRDSSWVGTDPPARHGFRGAPGPGAARFGLTVYAAVLFGRVFRPGRLLPLPSRGCWYRRVTLGPGWVRRAGPGRGNQERAGYWRWAGLRACSGAVRRLHGSPSSGPFTDLRTRRQARKRPEVGETRGQGPWARGARGPTDRAGPVEVAAAPKGDPPSTCRAPSIFFALPALGGSEGTRMVDV